MGEDFFLQIIMQHPFMQHPFTQTVMLVVTVFVSLLGIYGTVKKVRYYSQAEALQKEEKGAFQQLLSSLKEKNSQLSLQANQLSFQTGQLASQEQQIKSLNETLNSLIQAGGKDVPFKEVESALQKVAKGNPEAAKKLLNQIFQQKLDKANAAMQDAAAAARHFGTLASLTNDPNAALDAYHQAVKLAPDNLDGWNQFGLLLLNRSQFENAQQAFENLLSLANKDNQDKQYLVFAHSNLAKVHLLRGDLQQAEELALRSLEINGSLGNQSCEPCKAETHRLLSLIYLQQKDWQNFQSHIQESIDINRSLERLDSWAADLLTLGGFFFQHDDYPKAEKFLTESLKIFQKLNNQLGIASNYSLLGNIYLGREEWEKAEQLLIESLKILGHFQQKQGMMFNYSTLMELYLALENLPQAEKMFLEAREIFQTVEANEIMTVFMISNYENLGNFFKEHGNLEQAEKMYLQRDQLSQQSQLLEAENM